MAFSTGYLGDPQQVGGGERFGSTNIVLAARTFEDSLKVGRFAKLDTGSLDNIDGSVTPVLAGVVLRNAANPVEDGAVIDADLYDQVEYQRQGLVSVDVAAAATPAQFGTVFVSNQGDANDGLALSAAAAGDVTADAEFIEELATNVWLIRLK
jgi:hypothetical protein